MDGGQQPEHAASIGVVLGHLGALLEVLDREVGLTPGLADVRQGLEDLGIIRALLVQRVVEVPGLVGVGEVIGQQRPLLPLDPAEHLIV